MLTLAKYGYPRNGMLFQKNVDFCRNTAENAYVSSGLKGASDTSRDYSGVITIEDTPANVYGERLIKAVFYKQDTHTRRGYYAKYRITSRGLVAL